MAASVQKGLRKSPKCVTLGWIPGIKIFSIKVCVSYCYDCTSMSTVMFKGSYFIFGSIKEQILKIDLHVKTER